MSLLRLLWWTFHAMVVGLVADLQKAPTREAPEISKPTYQQTVFLP